MIIDVGIYKYRVTGLDSNYANQLLKLYPDSCTQHANWADFEINAEPSSFIRKYIKPQISLKIEGQQPFNPIATDKLLPSLEWAMNWCAAAFDHSRLLFHSAAVVKNNQAILFPAKSGSGKSTLSTFLGLNGWQLFSDEMAIIDLENAMLSPVFRPTSLKNESINIIKQAKPILNISQTTYNTHKGDIAHVQTNTREAFDHFQTTAASAIVFLRFDMSATHLHINELEKSVGMSHMLTHQFNYHVIGELAFECIVKLVNKVRFFEISYSNMQDVDEFLSDFVEGKPIDQ